MPRHKDLVRPGLPVDAFAAFHRRGSEAFALADDREVGAEHEVSVAPVFSSPQEDEETPEGTQGSLVGSADTEGSSGGGVAVVG